MKITKTNSVNLFQEFYINLNDNEIDFLKECIQNVEIREKGNVKYSEHRQVLSTINKIDRSQEFANLPYILSFEVTELGYYICLTLHNGDNWNEYEHTISFRTFTESDLFALSNLFLTQIYVIKEPFTKYIQKKELVNE